MAPAGEVVGGSWELSGGVQRRDPGIAPQEKAEKHQELHEGTWGTCFCSAWIPSCGRWASSPSISGCRRMWSHCGSVTSTIRAGDQTLTVPNERSRRLQDLLSQGPDVLSSAARGPFWCPRLQEPLLLRSLLLRMMPFPQFPSLLWFLPWHQTVAPALCRDGVNRGKGKEADWENVEALLPWPWGEVLHLLRRDWEQGVRAQEVYGGSMEGEVQWCHSSWARHSSSCFYIKKPGT